VRGLDSQGSTFTVAREPEKDDPQPAISNGGLSAPLIVAGACPRG